MVKEGSELVDSHLASSRPAKGSQSTLRWGFLLLDIFEAWRDSVEEILNSPLVVIESCSKGSNALLSGESHVHKLFYLGLLLAILGWLGLFRLLLLILPLFLLFLLFLGRLWLRLFLRLGCRFGDLIHADHEIGVLDAYLLD